MQAAGLLILTTGRVGVRRASASAGSGVVVIRQAGKGNNDDNDGGWSTPVGVRAYGGGAGPLAIGFDVADRVYVLQTREAVDRVLEDGFLLGPEASAVAGRRGGSGGAGVAYPASWPAWSAWKPNKSDAKPCSRCGHSEVVGSGGGGGDGDEEHGLDRGLRGALRHPVQCYMRSAGLYVGLQAEGLVLSARYRENAEFYGKPVAGLQGPVISDDGIKKLAPGNAAALEEFMHVLAKAETKD